MDLPPYYLSFAGLNIQVVCTDETLSLGMKIRELYKEFILEVKPKKIDYTMVLATNFFKITILRDVKNKNIFFIEFFRMKKNKIIVNNAIDPIYTQVIVRNIIIELLSIHGGFIFHSAGNIVNNKEVILFSANSGTGKSTTANTLSRTYKKFTDDLACIRKVKDTYMCFKLPIVEKNSEKITNLPPMPLKSVYFIVRSAQSRVVPITSIPERMKRVADQLWSDPSYVKNGLENVKKFVKEFGSIYKFHSSAIDLIENVIAKHIKSI